MLEGRALATARLHPKRLLDHRQQMLLAGKVAKVVRGLHDVVPVLISEYVINAEHILLLRLLSSLAFAGSQRQVDEGVEESVDLGGVVPVLLVDLLQHPNRILVELAAVALDGQSSALVLNEVKYRNLRLVRPVLKNG